MGQTFSVAPVCSHTSCHGTMFEWCSIQVTSTSSPGAEIRAAPARATRLMPSVQPLVKTTSRVSAALMNRFTAARVPSYASVARSLSRCVARWMFALACR